MIDLLLVGGAGVGGVAAAKALILADDNLRKALCISQAIPTVRFRSDLLFIANQPAAVVLEKYD